MGVAENVKSKGCELHQVLVFGSTKGPTLDYTVLSHGMGRLLGSHGFGVEKGSVYG